MSKNNVVVADALHDDLRTLRASIADQVAEQVKQSNAQVVVSNSAIETALDEALDRALSVDIFDVVTGGWRRWRDLQQAIAKSRDDEASHVVPLVEHSIDVAYKPSIELIVNGASLATIVLALEVSFSLRGFTVTLRQGTLTSIDTGECKTTGKLRLAGQVVWGGPLGSIDLPGHWTVDPPLALHSGGASSEG